MGELRRALEALRRPAPAFQGIAAEGPGLGASLRRMLAWWLPPALLHAGFTALSALRAWEGLRAGRLPPWSGLLPAWVDPDDLRELLAHLPPPPAAGAVGACLLILVPLGVLGIWLHDAVWDHTCLWLLGGLKQKRGFRATLVAEAQVLRVAALGSWVGLLGLLPVAGTLLALPLALLEGWLWILRGFALAAFHGCETWKGIAATVLHAVLMGLFALAFAAAFLILLGRAG
ncbi:MAG TPA: hypothetical protein VF804_07055 [Holophagaceae bacterium]